MTLVIREERERDHSAVSAVVERAFAREDEARLVERLRREASPLVSLVALDGERLVGHILFSPVTLETPTGPKVAMGLAPMAVEPGEQRRGVGSALVRAGLEACRKAGHRVVVVLGHADYYPRFGFETASRHGLRCEYDAPDESFMVQELVPGGLEGISGLVRYHPAFGAV